MTDQDWAKIITWMQANGIRLVIPLKGPIRFEKK